MKLADLYAAGIDRYVLHLAVNFTARRNFVLEPGAHSRGRRPTYGVLVRPLPRQHKGKTLDVYAFYDPRFAKPWLLATQVALKPESVYAIYRDRWPVEQIPLSAKQMVGAHRQFVHNPESIQRLPELALLAGSILSFLAATFPPMPTGLWDRKPKRTPGRFRRQLAGQPFPKDAVFARQLREKNSPTAHLPKGNLARQPKNASVAPVGAP